MPRRSTAARPGRPSGRPFVPTRPRPAWNTDGKLDFDYRVIRQRGNVLHLENAATGDAATYRREAIR